MATCARRIQRRDPIETLADVVPSLFDRPAGDTDQCHVVAVRPECLERAESRDYSTTKSDASTFVIVWTREVMTCRLRVRISAIHPTQMQPTVICIPSAFAALM